jgi:hypothetical protein
MSNQNQNPSNFRTYGVAFAGFAAGVLVTVVAVNAGAPSPSADPAQLVGTMVTRGGVAVGQDIAQLALDGAVTGSVAFAERDGTVTAEFNIDSADPVQVRVELPDASVAFSGFAQASGKPLPPATVEEGSISMVSKGPRHFALFLNKSSTEAKSVKVSFVQNGQVVREETVELPKS